MFLKYVNTYVDMRKRIDIYTHMNGYIFIIKIILKLHSTGCPMTPTLSSNIVIMNLSQQMYACHMEIFSVAALKMRRRCRYGSAARNKRFNVANNFIQFITYYFYFLFRSIPKSVIFDSCFARPKKKKKEKRKLFLRDSVDAKNLASLFDETERGK